MCWWCLCKLTIFLTLSCGCVGGDWCGFVGGDWSGCVGGDWCGYVGGDICGNIVATVVIVLVTVVVEGLTGNFTMSLSSPSRSSSSP